MKKDKRSWLIRRLILIAIILVPSILTVGWKVTAPAGMLFVSALILDYIGVWIISGLR